MGHKYNLLNIVFDIYMPLFQFFKEQNIDIKSRDNTKKVLKLCDQYNIKTRKIIFNRKTRIYPNR